MKCIELAKILMETPDREVLIEGEDNFWRLITVSKHIALEEGSISDRREKDIRNSTYYKLGIETLTPSLKKKGFSQKDVIENGEKVVVLWQW